MAKLSNGRETHCSAEVLYSCVKCRNGIEWWGIESQGQRGEKFSEAELNLAMAWQRTALFGNVLQRQCIVEFGIEGKELSGNGLVTRRKGVLSKGTV